MFFVGGVRAWCLLLAGLAFGAAAAAVPLVPDASAGDYPLGRYLDLFEDGSAQLRIEDVAAPENAGRFASVAGQGMNYGFRRSALWFRVQVDFSRGGPHDWVLLETHPIIDHVTFFLPDGRGGWDEVALGDARPYRERIYDHREFIVPVPRALATGPQPVTFYVREAGEGAINVDLRLSTRKALLERTNHQTFFYGLCYGALLLALIYNIALWLATREPAHPYYILFIAFTTLLFLNLDGFGLAYLWPAAPVVNAWFPQMICILMSAAMQFSRHFLDLQHTAPRLDRLIHAIAWLPLFALVLIFTSMTRQQGYVLMSGVSPVFILIMLALGIWRLRQGFAPARYFVAGWLVLLLGVTVTVVAYFRVFGMDQSPVHFARLGVVGQIALLAMALANRIALMKAENERMQRDMLANALRDPQTGLPNRHALENDLPEVVSRAQHDLRRCAVMQAHFTNIRRIGVTFGPIAGDSLLREAADRLVSLAGPGSRVFRGGEDEFVILLADVAGVPAAVACAESVLTGFLVPLSTGGLSVQLSLSLGVAVTGAARQDPLLLVRQAGLACKVAGEGGGSAYRVFTEEMGNESRRRVTLGNDLLSAIRDQQIEVRYIPSIDSRTGRCCGIEATLRWTHPVCGAVSEAELLQVAEEADQAIRLGQWIIETVCRDGKGLLRQGLEGVRVSVAVSARLFQHTGFIETLRAALAAADLPGNCLQLNVGESVLAAGVEPARERLEQCRCLGIHVSVIDIGTGKSSLACLLHLHISSVKVNGSLVGTVISDGRDAAIVKSIIAMAHHLGLRVLAENVENEAQAAFLRRCECDELQGSLFSPPLTIHEIGQYLFRERSLLPHREFVEAGQVDTILLVDDEPNILRALTRTLRRDGYHILVAGSAGEAFSLLAQHEVQLIISDQRMPGMIGTEFLSRVKELYPQTTRIVLSGYADLKTVTDAINKGAVYRFLTKPWEGDALRQEIRSALQQQRLVRNP
ncbi:MAG: EAL domain-containing protein [Pseudomonadota bacterium]